MRLFLAASGDGISHLLQQAMFIDNVEEIRRISHAVQSGNQVFESFALSTGGSTVESSPLFCLIEVDAKELANLESIKKQYQSATNTTVTVGIGHKTSEACKALKAAQLKGPGHTKFYTQEVEKELEKNKDKLDESQLAKKQDVIDLNTVNTPAAPVTAATVASAVNSGAVPTPDQGIPLEEPAIAPTQMADIQPINFEQEFRGHAQKYEDAEKARKLQTSQSYQEIKQKVADSLVKIKEQLPYIAQLRNSSPDAYESIIAIIQGVILLGRELDKTDQQIEKMEKNVIVLSNPPPPDTFDTVSGILESSELEKPLDPEQVAIGAQIEMTEHGLTLEEGTKIATDHLKEDPDYYRKETREKQEKEPDPLAKSEGFYYDGPSDSGEKKHYFVDPANNTKWLFTETEIPADAYGAEAASRLAQVLKMVHKQHPVSSYQITGKVGTIEPFTQFCDLTNTPPDQLTLSERSDVLIEFLIDWMIGNAQTTGEKLVRTAFGQIVGTAKIGAFKDFEGVGPYYRNLIDLCQNGTIELDIACLLPVLEILDFIDEDSYLDNVGQYAQCVYKNDINAQIQFATKVLQRKKDVRKLFTDVLEFGLSKGERPEYGKMRSHIKGGSLVNLPVGSTVFGKIKVRHWDGSESWKSIKSGAILGMDPGVAGEGHAVSSKNPGAK